MSTMVFIVNHFLGLSRKVLGKYRSLKGQEEDHSQTMNIIKLFFKEEKVPCHLNDLRKQKDLG